jgi:DNA-binding PadR family transcriptional regulator
MQNDPQHLLLVSLARGPRHGYAIRQDIAEQCDIRLGPGTLYGAIARLEQRGLLQLAATNGRRNTYELTVAGRLELAERLSTMSSLVALGQQRLASS